MRFTIAIALVAASASLAVADGKPVSLSATDVKDRLAVVSSDVEQCYLDAKATGKLELTLSIDKRGELYDVAVATPDLSSKRAKKVAACIEKAVAGLAFAEAKTSTTATVPFYFQRTVAPGAGPQYSCYSASGCK